MDYKELIIEMIKKINNQEFLQMIYGFVKAIYKNDAGV